MDVFSLRDTVVGEYRRFATSFTTIHAEDIRQVEATYAEGRFWPEPLIQINPSYKLDAAFFHLYGLSRDDSDYVMDTFPIVRRNDEKARGEYRAKRVILEINDAMAEGTRTGRPYQTRLDPPPADPRVAHADTRPAAERKGAS